MSPDHMEDVAISLAVEKQCQKRCQAIEDPTVDPSLYTPWGMMGPADNEEGKKFSGKIKQAD
jgi:hypothetical protein